MSGIPKLQNQPDNLSPFSPGRVWFSLVLTFLMVFAGWNVMGQRVNITSIQSPDPTAANPISIDIKFEDGVDVLKPEDFIITNSGSLQNLQRWDMNFKFNEQREIDDFNLRINQTELIQLAFAGPLNQIDERIQNYVKNKLKEVVISIDFNGQDELFFLTLNDGIFKFDASGNHQQVISQNKLDTPLDFAINKSNGNFYVADSGKRQVLVFDSSYNELQPIGSGSNAESDGPRGATGVAINSAGNIYVADNFTGDTQNQDAIKIYSPNGNLIKKISKYNNQNIQDPYRIAVDKNDFIYVSESKDNGRVIIYDNSYNSIKIISNSKLGSPGSLLIDNYGYLYIVDYEDDFKLLDIYNNPLSILTNYEKIRDTKYSVKVFDINTDFSFVKEFGKDNLNLPIDLGLNTCGLIHVNNLKLEGEKPSGDLFGVPTEVDINFAFSLVKFQREDSFTAELVLINPGLVELILENKNLFKCGPQPSGQFSIVYQTEEPEASFDCDTPANLILQLDNNCEYISPDYYSFITNPTGFENSPFIVTKEVFENNVLTINFKVYDGENGILVGECSFTATLEDKIAPIIDCSVPGLLSPNEKGRYFIPDYSSRVTDNCDDTPTIFQDPVAGTEVTLDTTVTMTATDDAGNASNVCTFSVELSEEPKSSFSCPADVDIPDLFFDANCNIIEPDFSGLLSDFINFKNTPYFVQTSNRSNNILNLKIKVYDGQNGDLVGECTFEVNLIDNLKPIINCPTSPQTISKNSEGKFILPNYTNIASDNCDSNLNVTQNPLPGEITSDATVTIIATDAAGNVSGPCTFSVEISEGPKPSFSCPAPNDIPDLFLDANCDFAEPDFSGLLSGFMNFENAPYFEQTSNRLNNILNLKIIVYDGQNGDLVGECTFEVDLRDTIPPVAKCATTYDIWLSASGNASLTLAEINNQSSDNCGIESMVIDKTTFTPADVGIIMVTLTVIDGAGNSGSCETSVLIHPYEPESPSEETFEYIFIYPNPTSGSFTFDTPSGWSIEKVEVFDARGRYVLTETYSENQIEYSMDLSSLQQAVYILKLYTSRGIRIIRVIID